MDSQFLKHIKLSGGFGNQLFQYFFGEYLKEKYNCSISFFSEPALDINRLQIHRFFPALRISHNTELRPYHYAFTQQLAYRCMRKLLLLFPFLNRKVKIENGSNYQNQSFNDTYCFDGYWQSYRYLSAITPSLQFEDQRINDISADYINAIEQSEAVFLHIRRGDYLNKENQKVFAECPLNYFENAANRIKEDIKNVHFFVFSNDIQWVKSHLKLNDNEVTFIQNEGNSCDLKDFYLMTRCKHAIISNSTFSWWAAYLINNCDKKVIAPKHWYNDISMNNATKDLIPPTWIRL